MSLLLSLMLSLPPTKVYPATYRTCYDGDTCTFDMVLSDTTTDVGTGITQEIILRRVAQKVRLCDINAPEMKPGPNPNAIKARDDLITWITAAKTLQLEIAQKPNCESPPQTSCDEFEKYGRLLAYIIADGVNLNQKQVAQQNAVPFILCK